jgi:hypothetical protein
VRSLSAILSPSTRLTPVANTSTRATHRSVRPAPPA